MRRSRESSGAAAVMSFLIPGLGQIFNGQIGKGLIIFISCLVLCAIFIGIPIAIGVWLWGVADAYSFGQAAGKKYYSCHSTRVSSTNLNDVFGGKSLDD